MKPNAIIINPNDTVAVALEDIPAGGQLRLPDGAGFEALTAVPYSHKIALRDMTAGETVLKYGESIGRAKGPIRRGDWIHTHNLDLE